MYKGLIGLLAIYMFTAFAAFSQSTDTSNHPQAHLRDLYKTPELLDSAVAAMWYFHQRSNATRPPQPTSGTFADLSGHPVLSESQLKAILQLTHCSDPQALKFTISSADTYSITIDGHQCEPKSTKPRLSPDGNTIFSVGK